MSSITLRVKNYVKPEDTLSQRRSKETLVASQNRLADILRRLIEVKNLITIGSATTYNTKNLTTSTKEKIKKAYPVNEKTGKIESESFMDTGELTNLFLTIVKESNIIRIQNLNVAAMIDKAIELNIGENFGDILKNTDKILDILNAGLSISDLSDVPVSSFADMFNSLNLEDITKSLSIDLLSFTSNFSLEGLFDKTFNDLLFTLEPVDISAKIGLGGFNIDNEFLINFGIGAISALIGTLFDDNGNSSSGSSSSSQRKSTPISNPNNTFFKNSKNNNSYTYTDSISKSLKKVQLTNTTEVTNGIKTMLTDMCEFNSGMECCTEQITKKLENNEPVAPQVNNFLQTLEKSESLLGDMLAILDFIVYVIEILIEVFKKLIDEIIYAISLLKDECTDGKGACLCEVKL